MRKTIVASIIGFLMMMTGVAGATIQQPSFNPPYKPMEGKTNSIDIECNDATTVRFTYTPWNHSSGWLGIEDNEGDNDIFQHEWQWGDSVVLPNRSGLVVHYYSGSSPEVPDGHYIYNIIPGKCIEDVPPSTTTTTAPTTTTTQPTTTTTESPQPPTTTTAPPSNDTTTTTEAPPVTVPEAPTSTTLGVPVSTPTPGTAVPLAQVAGITPADLASGTEATTQPRYGLLAVTGGERILFSLLAMISCLAIGTPMWLFYRKRGNAS